MKLSPWNERFIFFDLETTDLTPGPGRILSAHFIKTDKYLNTLGERSGQVKPAVWSDEAYKVHGIPKHVADNYPSLWKLVGVLSNWIDVGTCMVCHANYNTFGQFYYFDLAFLLHAFVECNLRFEFNNRCTYRLSTHTLYLYYMKYGLVPMLKRGQRSLKEMTIALGGTLENHHDAKEDTRACRFIFEQLIRIQRAQRGMVDDSPWQPRRAY